MALSLSSIQSQHPSSEKLVPVPTGEHDHTVGATSAEVAALPKTPHTAGQNLGAPDAQGMPPSATTY